ncbi:plasmid pRiA4b ORF-3 family protein [Thermoanaerobacter ethanolicus]|uniref:plasmid pRiA4b ORF-3 family protein n=1 Tax=Thermoanaerobacter ethanolicus TaxID=1757 RepID=UPI00296F9B41
MAFRRQNDKIILALIYGRRVWEERLMLIQCTRKLLNELKIDPLPYSDEDPLFCWHANLITLNRRKSVALVNDKNRYVVVLYNLKAKDFKKLDEIIQEGIRKTFLAEHIKEEVVEEYMRKANGIIYAKTKDKFSVARMNKSCEVVGYGEDLLKDRSIFQTIVSRKTNRYFIGDGRGGYIRPSEEMFKDLQEFWGKPIFGSKAVKVKAKLELERHNVWRELIIPLNMTFREFHKALQIVFGWRDYHLHEFYIYSDEVYKNRDYKPVVRLVGNEEAFDVPTEIETKLERDIVLSEYIPYYRKLKYIYDFGANWQIYIDVEDVTENYELNHPVCLDGEGDAPPEDIDGETAYENFLKAVENVKASQNFMVRIIAAARGYREFDIAIVNNELKWYCV